MNGKEQTIGTFGILHPDVLSKFELPYVADTVRSANAILTVIAVTPSAVWR